MKGIGIVFAGGGGKGAYEIGIWKYLHEVGLDQYIRAVSGTSVGALNAALFVGSNFETAEELWLNITKEKILSRKEWSLEEIIKWLAPKIGMLGGKVLIGAGIAAGALQKVAISASQVATLMVGRMKSDYMFSRRGLEAMISEGVNFNILQNSEIPCFVTCLRVGDLKIERFKLNNYTARDAKQLLLASSAIPVIFPNEEFDGKLYCDGGIPIIGDNIPIKPVYDTGVEHIIVIHLNQDSIIDRKAFPNANIIEIIPSNDLGNALTGTLDFSPAGSSKRIDLGYLDAKKILQPMVEKIYMNIESQKLFSCMQNKNREFEHIKQNLKQRELEIKAQQENDGFDEMRESLHNWIDDIQRRL